MKKIYILMQLIMIVGMAICVPELEAAPRQSADSLRQSASFPSYLELKGTLFPRSLNPLAMIEDKRSGQVTTYELGDYLDGAELIHITRGEVILKSATGEYRLSFPTGAIMQPHGLVYTTEQEKWYDIERNGNTFILSGATVTNALGRVSEIIRNMRIQPSFIDGKQSGIIIARLAPIGVLKEAGVEEGDIIKSINGYKLNSSSQIFNTFRALKAQKEIKVEIIRDRRPLELTYIIKG